MTTAERLARARLALDGLSVGDAFGETFFRGDAAGRLERRELAKGKWRWTDDTAMALGIVEVIEKHGAIEQSALAATFARNYTREPDRGYGRAAHSILQMIGSGIPWHVAAGSVFGGAGSMGNGSAMRIAPLGAFFADDLDRVVEQARLSAEVTHRHSEGIAGAIATAVAAAAASSGRTDLLAAALARTPDGDVRRGLVKAAALKGTWREAARDLGNGSAVTCPDTVPFCLWAAEHYLGSYAEAMWATASAFGDIDTNCAIVGGIVALRSAVPADWVARREPLP